MNGRHHHRSNEAIEAIAILARKRICLQQDLNSCSQRTLSNWSNTRNSVSPHFKNRDVSFDKILSVWNCNETLYRVVAQWLVRRT